jgi:mono/diheme cytochrome c family protein
MKSLIIFIAGLIATPILFGIAAIAGWLPSDAASAPPAWENTIGGRALDASLEKRSGALKNPVAPSDAGAFAAAAKIYGDNCAGCHGSAKGPSDWGAKGLYPRAPQFFQQSVEVSPPEAYAAIHDGIRYSGMGAWRDQLKDDEMWKVANYVASVRANGGTMKDMD